MKFLSLRIFPLLQLDICQKKLEKLNENAKIAFREYLGVDVIKIKNQNLGENKEYSSVYRKFKESVKLPKSYVDLMYNSKFALHFYSNEEIDLFRKRWSDL